jgi:hypothetical protein
MTTQKLSDFIHISPGFKAAVNLQNDRNNLEKVGGFIPTEVAKEIILDLARKLHPTSDLRSRIIMGTYGTGKSHLALVLLNFFVRSLETKQLQKVIEKLDPDTKGVLIQLRELVPEKFLVVNLYGDAGNIADSLMMGLRQALEAEGLAGLLPSSAFDAALSRIEEIEKKFPESFTLLKDELANNPVEQDRMSVEELKTRLQSYQKKAFDVFRSIHPLFSAGSQFEFATMLSPNEFYTTVVKDLKAQHGFAGIAVFWDEFGHKMGEVVKDPTGKEGLVLQEFAECCNASEENQLHFYLFCHRSLKEYHDISMNAMGANSQHLEDDLRKIEGRFKQYIMKSTDVETFQLIDGVIVADVSSPDWKLMTTNHNAYFDSLVQETARLKYFTGFTLDELKATVVLGTYPLHPMSVYSLPAISEKVAQNNRTLFTCLCEDEPGSFNRYLAKTVCDAEAPAPPMFTVDGLWDYFANDVKQQERTFSIYRDFEHLKTRLDGNDALGLRILKAVSVFRVTNPTRFKVTEEILTYSLDIPKDEKQHFRSELNRHSDMQNENHILMKRQADGSYRPAVSSATESLMEKVRKLLNDTPEKLGLSPVQYLKSLWSVLPVGESYEATSYEDEYGVVRQLLIEPISMNQLKESLHILTKNIGTGTFQDGILLVVICASSSEIEVARNIATTELADQKYNQVVLAIPHAPVQVFSLLKEHQALSYLKTNEASLYAEGGELHEQWCFFDDDKSVQLKAIIGDLFSPEKQMLDYFWQGHVHKVLNSRQVKKLTSDVMKKVFPDCPNIHEPKLALDDFGGNWGYRNDCRDIIIKMASKGAAEKLWNETATAPTHVITQIFKSNGILRKNQAGEYVIEKPDESAFNGASKTWECIEKYINKARSQPVKMDNLVRVLRKPPFGIKCRVIPLFFAAVAHNDLAFGNISFEFQRNANQVEKITVIERDTLEKVFTAPEKYKLVYVNVSSNQNALINGLARLFNVDLTPADPPLERVKKVGVVIGGWWRTLPVHVHLTEEVSDGAWHLREHIFKPLAELEPEIQQILLKDFFEHVFDDAQRVTQKQIEDGIKPFKEELEALLGNLKTRIIAEYVDIFGEESNPGHGLTSWFTGLSKEKQTHVYVGEMASLVNICRESSDINNDTLLKIAEKMTGLLVSSWGDDLVVKFGAKLESAKKFVDAFEPTKPAEKDEDDEIEPISPPPPGQGSLSMFLNGRNEMRTFEIMDSLSPNGDVLENMLNSTLEQLGKGLDEQEKVAIIYRVVGKHVFGA